MSATAMRMPLRTSQDAPRFCGDANDLPRYLAEVEALCHSRGRSAKIELIKWAVYYTDEASWSTFAAAQDALADPACWIEFQAAIQDLYPRYKVIHAAKPLHATLQPPAAIPMLLSPVPSPAAVLLAPDALEALLSFSAPPTLPLPPPACRNYTVTR